MDILVVDDEPDMKTLFEQRFRKEIKKGLVKFTFANSGEQALTYLDDQQPKEVRVLSDINMPGMSGLELLKLIKGRVETPPSIVMMLTANGDAQNYSQAMRLGADDFLTKPIDFNLLKEKLNIESNGQNFGGG